MTKILEMKRPSTAVSLPFPTIAYSPNSSPTSSSNSSSDTPFTSFSALDIERPTSAKSLRRTLLTKPFTFDDLLVAKSRKPRFDLTLQIHDLNNVPLVSGVAYVKWHLHNSTRADARGRTDKAPIKDHKVTWRYERQVSNIRIGIDRNGTLNDQLLLFEIVQEYTGRERIALGTVTLNLAEYAGIEKETRRYLMQDSRINSTIKITLSMTQMSGDLSYKTPPLRGAQVFGGIAGIINDQQQQLQQKAKESEMSSLGWRSREAGFVQDMYRRNLAASWQSGAGEPSAEDCIEDIFAGGDGWVSNMSSTLTGRPASRVGWWIPQSQKSGGSGGSRDMETSSIVGSQHKAGEGGSDSDSVRSGVLGGADQRLGQRKIDASCLHGTERKKGFGNSGASSIDGDDGGLDSFSMLNSVGGLHSRGGRKLDRNFSEPKPTRQEEIDEVAAREDLKSWCQQR